MSVVANLKKKFNRKIESLVAGGDVGGSIASGVTSSICNHFGVFGFSELLPYRAFDEENNISEGPGFNIFCVDETGLNSPNKGVLEGITRQTVLDLAKELNLPFQLSSISLEKLKSSNEVFATSTAGGIMPITKINGELIGQGAPGEITRKLHKAYWGKHSDPSWSVSKEDLLKQS